MLSPEVWNFPPPKTICSCKKSENIDAVVETIKMNNFYKSIVITCPDELQTPSFIEEIITEDTDYYKLSDCSLTEFIETNFVDNFIKHGRFYCLSIDRNCIIQNCAAITPDGILTIHILDYVFQTLGIEGKKRPHNFYEVKIDLKNLLHVDKLKVCLGKLENFDFYISWEPNQEDVCPSSIAKYFCDRNKNVSQCSLTNTKLSPFVTEIPAIEDVEPDELTEWIGMLALEADLSPTETYISTYSQPESENALKSSRISLLITKGFLTPTTVSNICESMSNYVSSRNLDGYWAAVSVQSCENSLWQWNRSSPMMFQAHNSSCNIFFTSSSQTMYSIGQIKYS